MKIKGKENLASSYHLLPQLKLTSVLKHLNTEKKKSHTTMK